MSSIFRVEPISLKISILEVSVSQRESLTIVGIKSFTTSLKINADWEIASTGSGGVFGPWRMGRGMFELWECSNSERRGMGLLVVCTFESCFFLF